MNLSSDWLRKLNDTEIRALSSEFQERAEQFDAKTRMLVNDELRRRRMPTVQGRRW